MRLHYIRIPEDFFSVQAHFGKDNCLHLFVSTRRDVYNGNNDDVDDNNDDDGENDNDENDDDNDENDDDENDDNDASVDLYSRFPLRRVRKILFRRFNKTEAHKKSELKSPNIKAWSLKIGLKVNPTAPQVELVYDGDIPLLHIRVLFYWSAFRLGLFK